MAQVLHESNRGAPRGTPDREGDEALRNLAERSERDSYTPATRRARTAVRASALAEGLRRRVPRLSQQGSFAEARADGVVADAEERLARRIRAHLRRGRLQIKLTDNRYTMISVRRGDCDGPEFRVRLHHMFADATPAVTQALAKYIDKNDAAASRLLGEYIDDNQHRVRAETRRKRGPRLCTKGQFHDLAQIYQDLNKRYFAGAISADITWGQRCGKPRRRNSIKMGSYSVEDRLIRIHRSLDRAFVPRFFVEWVVYHEMLHQVHEAPIVNGRRQFHTRAFQEDEARFEHFLLARHWEREHLDRLLTY